MRAVLGAGVEIDSAGTAGWHIGKPPYGPMRQAARAKGLDLSPLRARQVNKADFDRFDLILAMDADNLRDLRALQPKQARARLALYLDPLGCGDVPDPYYTRDFDGALRLIQEAASAWAAQISGLRS